jgi:hypothetical protein
MEQRFPHRVQDEPPTFIKLLLDRQARTLAQTRAKGKKQVCPPAEACLKGAQVIDYMPRDSTAKKLLDKH